MQDICTTTDIQLFYQPWNTPSYGRFPKKISTKTWKTSTCLSAASVAEVGHLDRLEFWYNNTRTLDSACGCRNSCGGPIRRVSKPSKLLVLSIAIMIWYMYMYSITRYGWVVMWYCFEYLIYAITWCIFCYMYSIYQWYHDRWLTKLVSEDQPSYMTSSPWQKKHQIDLCQTVSFRLRFVCSRFPNKPAFFWRSLGALTSQLWISSFLCQAGRDHGGNRFHVIGLWADDQLHPLKLTVCPYRPGPKRNFHVNQPLIFRRRRC